MRKRPFLQDANAIGKPSQDRFGRSAFAAMIARIVRTQGDLGLVVIAVEGAWGEGKSSVLAMAAREYRRDPRNRVVTIAAWRTSNQDQFLANLSWSISTALRRDWQTATLPIAFARLLRQPLPIVIAIFAPLLYIAAMVALPNLRGWTHYIADMKPEDIAASVGLFGLPALAWLFAKVSAPISERLAVFFGTDRSGGVGAAEQFAEEFDVLGAAQPRGTRFLILVEDLDRCTPAHVTDVLSAIAQLSSHPKAGRLAFLLAYDRAVLLESIEQDAVKHLPESKRKSQAVDYLKRVVQLELPLPRPISGVPGAELSSVPRFPTLVRGLLVSAALVAAIVHFLSADAAARVSALTAVGVTVAFGVEWLIGFYMRCRLGHLRLNDWEQAVAAAEPWLEGNLRSRARTLNHAAAALLLRSGSGLTAWEAVSIAAIEAKHPEAFGPEELARTLPTEALDLAHAFRSTKLTETIGEMSAAGHRTEHFTNAAKLLAVVGSYKR